ncbi:S8 family serine peptidase [Vibrio sp. S12_S33]|nr:S8 family serine peptidase [Vibrio sp. S12_S33]
MMTFVKNNKIYFSLDSTLKKIKKVIKLDGFKYCQEDFMKLKFLMCAMILSFSSVAHAIQVKYAQENIDYDAVVVKFKTSIKDINAIRKAINNKFPNTDNDDVFYAYKNHTGNKETILNRYVKIRIPTGFSGTKDFINEVISIIKDFDSVELVYPQTPGVGIQLPPPPQILNKTNQSLETTQNYETLQYYLNAPDKKKPNYQLGGINAHYAWSVSGGDGSEITVIQKEIDRWNESHEDLPRAIVQFTPSNKVDDHETASMGIMGGIRNGYGVTGIVYNAQFGRAGPGSENFPDLLNYLKPGDVIQIGMQANMGYKDGCTKSCYGPVEYQQLWFDFIKELTDNGIHVIEAAGNGSLNLDSQDFKGLFDRNIRDSGANIVGAVCASDNKTASFSDYGSRIDNSSWGCWDVVTAGYNGLSSKPNANYTDTYSGTSSANPIIAGATASLSGVAKAHDISITPKALRQLLIDTGTPVGSKDRYIGTQPNLKAAIDALLGNSNNTPPVAKATVDKSIITDNESIILNGQQSTDMDGDELTYQWSQLSPKEPKAIIQSPSSSMTLVSFSDIGQKTYYSFMLTVSDGQFLNTDEVTITVNPEFPVSNQWDRYKTYSNPCNRVSWNGKQWDNQWHTVGEEPGTTGDWGAWRQAGGSTENNCEKK